MLGQAGTVLVYGAAFGAVCLALIGFSLTRDAAAFGTLAWSGGSALRADAAGAFSPSVLVSLEVVVLGATVALAWRARRGWPVAAVVLQGVGLAALLAWAFDGRVSAEMLERLSQTTTAAALLLLVCAAVFARIPENVEAVRGCARQ